MLWLFDDYVCEAGNSNIMFFWINEEGEKELITPTLKSDMILPGVTRDSILRLTESWGEFKVNSKDFTMK